MNCDGYKKLLASVQADEIKIGRDCRAKLQWIVDRANHYASATGLQPEAILDAWESRRDYWYMNYYQASNQPLIDGGRVRVFDTVQHALEAIGKDGFRCPHCRGISTNPYACNSATRVGGKECDWKVFGFFRELGRGIYVFVKDKMSMELIFMPVAWEWPNDEVKP